MFSRQFTKFVSLAARVPSTNGLVLRSNVAMKAAATSRWYSAAGALSHDQIRDRIFAVLHDFDKVKQENVSETADFQKDLGLDSLDTVEVVMAIEEEFGVEIPDQDADNIANVADAIKFIASSEGAN
ncbi:Acyl carrier protein, mitochondrial [Smittium mucronatum]|uniref:Acyl carrier protein n=1 Tax=Smittium mucronatum TaxID=133383 RepID=A0A1R0H408_9FUNG|nr:Acyl carrier protein, mitochondrial [Smittium mucronatum]